MSIESEEAEREANLFAMALLMPESLVREEIDKTGGFDIVEGCKDLAKKFRVTETLMTLRLGQIYGNLSRVRP